MRIVPFRAAPRGERRISRAGRRRGRTSSPGHGGSAAGPIVQKVLARYFEKRAVQDVPAQVAWVASGSGERRR